MNRSLTSKIIEGHKSSSNFSVYPTLPLLDGQPPSCSLFPSLSISLSFSLFCSMQKLIYTQMFLDTFSCQPLFKLYFAVWGILLGIKGEIFFLSLSSPFHSLSLYASPFHSPFHLSLSPSIFLSLSFYLSLSLLLSLSSLYLSL